MEPTDEERELFTTLDEVVAALVRVHQHAPEDRCVTCDAIETGEHVIQKYAKHWKFEPRA